MNLPINYVKYELSFEVAEYHRLSRELAALFSRIMALTQFLPPSFSSGIVPDSAACFHLPVFHFPPYQEAPKEFTYLKLNMDELMQREYALYYGTGPDGIMKKIK